MRRFEGCGSCRAFLLRDVLEEMQIDGVTPNWQTWSVALNAASRQRMLPDACFYFQEMQRTGHKPTVPPPSPPLPAPSLLILQQRMLLDAC